MKCAEVTTLSPLFFTGEMDGAQAAQFASHLADCAVCRREVEEQGKWDAALRSGVMADAVDSVALEARVRSMLKPRLSAGRWMAIAAAVVLMVGAGVLGYRVWVVTEPAAVYADVARHHRREVVGGEQRNWLRDAAAVQTLAGQQGILPSAVLALAPAGYHLDKGKVCRLHGRPYLHLVYTNGSQQFSAFLRPRNPEPLPGAVSEVANGMPLREVEIDQEHLSCVQAQGLTAMFVTETSSADALSLGRFAAGVL